MRVVFFVFIFSSLAGAQYSVQILRDINYANDTNPAQTMTICKPVGVTTSTPALVAIHGGGWKSGDKSDAFMQNLCSRLARQGY